jgi:hypothetical protein
MHNSCAVPRPQQQAQPLSNPGTLPHQFKAEGQHLTVICTSHAGSSMRPHEPRLRPQPHLEPVGRLLGGVNPEMAPVTGREASSSMHKSSLCRCVLEPDTPFRHSLNAAVHTHTAGAQAGTANTSAQHMPRDNTQALCSDTRHSANGTPPHRHSRAAVAGSKHPRSRHALQVGPHQDATIRRPGQLSCSHKNATKQQQFLASGATSSSSMSAYMSAKAC